MLVDQQSLVIPSLNAKTDMRVVSIFSSNSRQETKHTYFPQSQTITLTMSLCCSLIYRSCFCFGFCYPTCPVCQGDSAALIKSEEHCRLSPDIAAVRSLSTQTNLHHVSCILSPRTHSCSPRNMLQQNKVFSIQLCRETFHLSGKCSCH